MLNRLTSVINGGGDGLADDGATAEYDDSRGRAAIVAGMNSLEVPSASGMHAGRAWAAILEIASDSRSLTGPRVARVSEGPIPKPIKTQLIATPKAASDHPKAVD